MTLMQTEGLDSYGCFSIENHKFICVCLKNSILETMSLQHSCWNLKLTILSKVCSISLILKKQIRQIRVIRGLFFIPSVLEIPATKLRRPCL